VLLFGLHVSWRGLLRVHDVAVRVYPFPDLDRIGERRIGDGAGDYQHRGNNSKQKAKRRIHSGRRSSDRRCATAQFYLSGKIPPNGTEVLITLLFV